MLATLLVSLAAFLLIYAYLARKRLAVERLREELDGLQEQIENMDSPATQTDKQGRR